MVNPPAPRFPPETAAFTCPQCRSPQTAAVRRVIDATDAAALRDLLSGRLNVASCPTCGAVFKVPVPILYHNAAAEAAFVLLPTLDQPREVQEREIGQLTNRVLDALPPEQRKMYLLQPQTFISEASFLDAVGRAAPKPTATTPPPSTPALGSAAAPAEGQADGGAVAMPTLDELVAALEEARREGALDEAAAMLRPILDYNFFAALTARIEAGGPDAPHLVTLRTELLAAVDRVDEEARVAVEQAVATLQAVLRAPDPVAEVQARAAELTPTFFIILQANIEAAAQDDRHDLAALLQSVEQVASVAYEERLPPRHKLVNRLARAATDAERAALLEADAGLIDEELVSLLQEGATQARQMGADDIAANLEAALATTGAP